MTHRQPKESRPEQVIDLTGGDSRYIEVHTDAGIIRVNTGLVSTAERLPVVTVEVEVNDEYRRRTPAGGRWAMAGRYGYSDQSSYQVRLIRVDD